MDRMLATGRVQRPHGVEGYLKVESFSGEIKHLLRLRSVVLGNETETRSFEVEDCRRNFCRYFSYSTESETEKEYLQWIFHPLAARIPTHLKDR